MTRRTRSFRTRLAVRIAAALGAIVVLGSGAGYWVLRTTLYERLDAVVLRLATIEAAATADSPNETVHFHDAVFAGTSGSHDSVLVRYAEVWTLGGDPVVHTANLGPRHLSLSGAVRTRVASSGQAEIFTISFEGQRFRSVLYPLGLVGPQHQAHLLQVAVAMQDTEATMRRVAAFLAMLVVAGVALGASVGWWLAGYAVRPVLAIIGEAESMDASRHGHRIAVEADSSELHRLVAVLNALLARIDVVIESQRRFLADAGHAIKTPLTVLRGDVDVALRKDRSPEEFRKVLEQSSVDMRDVSALAEDLITLARSDSGGLSGPRDVIPVAPLLAAVTRRFEQAASTAGVEMTVDADDALAVEADGALLERALNNVVDNAVKYAGRGARVDVGVRRAVDRWVEIAVCDTGPGIPAAEQPRVFDRFFRGEAARRAAPGSGIGLAIVRASIESFGGQVELRSEPGRGTTVLFRCPRAS